MLEKFSKLFRVKPKKFLGIDIGASSVRMVELSRKGKGFKLENYGEMSLAQPDGKPFKEFKGNTIRLSSKEVAENISAIIKEARIETKDACFSIPDFGTFFTNIEIPVMDEEEIAQAVKYQSRTYIPLSLDDVTLDWSVVEGTPSKTSLKILVVAIPNDIIAHYKKVTVLTSLNLRFLEPEVFALARSLVKEDKKVSGLIDIGATSTTCSILEDKKVKISHSFNVAGNELTNVIARSLNIGYNEAEDLKKKQGLLPKDETGNPEDIRKLLIPLVGSILDETKKAFRDFYTREGKEVQEVLLSGGLALMPGLKEFFSVELKKPIILSDPFFGIEAPAMLSNTLKEIGPYYGVAIGLALKGLE